jgi:dGTPase
VEQVRQQAGTGEARNPIAFLVEAADDAVYNAVDLEDGFRKGILDWGFLKTELEKCAPNDDMLRDCVRYAEERMELPEVDLPGRAKDNALIQYFRVRAIGRVVTGAADAFKANYGQIIEGDFHHELVAKSSAAKFVEACRNVNRSFVYCSDETLKLELMGRRIIKDLMDIFWEGAANPESDKSDFPGKAFSLLSDNYRSVFDHARKSLALPERYYQLQLVTDYVCGMTDNFAAELHRRLTNG